MYTSRDLVICALNNLPVHRVPRDWWPHRDVRSTGSDDIAELDLRYPRDIVQPPFSYGGGNRGRGRPGSADGFVDSWGCTWREVESGRASGAPPLSTRGDMASYDPPFEILRQADLTQANGACDASSRFVLARTETRPLDRLRLLRGGESIEDLRAGDGDTERLLRRIHEFCCEEMQLWATSQVDGVCFRDDLGTQTAQRIDPKLWREIFEPLYADYCAILHGADKFVFFQTTEAGEAIIEDLIGIGVDAVHLPLSPMGVERFGRRHRSRITLWGEPLDTRLQTGTHGCEIREAVFHVRRQLDYGGGGVIAQHTWRPNMSRDLLIAIMEQWMAPLPMHA